jgi:hypothetical protein
VFVYQNQDARGGGRLTEELSPRERKGAGEGRAPVRYGRGSGGRTEAAGAELVA